MKKNNEPKVGVLGAGAWGTTIAQLLSKNNSEILIWAKERSVVNNINTKHINNSFLPNIKLSKRIKATSSLEEFNNINFLFVVIPVQYISSTLKKLKKIVGNDCVFINASKGIEIKSLKLVSHLINDAFPKNKIAILSGPNFAKEIAAGKPTASLIAANSLKKAKNISELISSKYFRPYLSDDILGAQICGAMKNVYAIGCGIIEGKQFGENAAASIISRGFAEIKLVCKKLGGETETLMGLSGLGDLFLTCSSNKSRNFSLGLNLAKGKNFENLLKSKKTIAEGAYTVKAIQRLSKKLKINLPLNDAIYKILYQNKNIDKTINELLNRPIRTEK
jgi:glycerol-3-phosphate dehydrogenase (NAD(P)+)